MTCLLSQQEKQFLAAKGFINGVIVATLALKYCMLREV